MPQAISEINKEKQYPMGIPAEQMNERNLDRNALTDVKDRILNGQEASMKHVFLIDDDKEIRTHLGTFLEDLGYRVTSFGSSNEALAALQEKK